MTGHHRPRWIFLALALTTAAACVALGLWQLARLDHRRAANGIARITRALPPRIYPGGGYLAPDVPVTATGTYDSEHQFVLRGRAHDGAPGVEIATPLRMAGTDTALIVVRGFVPSDDAMTVDRSALREEGVRTVHGIAFAMPMVGIPVLRNNDTTWDRLPGAWLRDHFPYPVYPYALWQSRDSGMTGFPIRLGAPALTDGPHLNYALQWFGFAIIFAGGGIAYSFGKRNKDRETRDENRETRNDQGTHQGS